LGIHFKLTFRLKRINEESEYKKLTLKLAFQFISLLKFKISLTLTFSLLECRKNLEGIFVPHITPFDKKGEVDWEALWELVEFLIKGELAGLVPCGSNSKASHLLREERKRGNFAGDISSIRECKSHLRRQKVILAFNFMCLP